VNAVAGSGKTTSLVQAARLLTAQALFVAFNKHIAEELPARLQGTPMRAKTIHSIGYACLLKHLGKMRIDDRKYNKLCREVVQARIVPMPGEDQRKAVGALQQLVNFARLTLTSPTNRAALEEMIDHYGIELDPKIGPTLFAELPRVLAEGERIAERQKIIDFTDQVYLPHRWQLQPPRLAFIFVDECQDLNAAQLDLVLKCRAEGGRMVFVGDPKQCQPPGTLIRLADVRNVPIEHLCVGDRVITYDRHSSTYLKSGQVTEVAHRPYEGQIYAISAGGKTTGCTTNHRWLVRWTGDTEGNW
jgi:DNA helicase-2/ATP-dependent DNA helicase PcrA